MKILIIEDEYNLADAIKARLIQERYEVRVVTDGEEGRQEALSGVDDLIILDVMLPGINGFEILREIREYHIETKVLMLTAKAALEDKLTGFDAGADDYLTKPFHTDELIARVNVLLRRGSKDSEKLTFGNMELDLSGCNIKNRETGASIEVMGKEFQLLTMLLENRDFILSKEMIFNKIWGMESESSFNCVEAYVSFIRKKLRAIGANVTIRTIRNMGYRLVVENEKDEK